MEENFHIEHICRRHFEFALSEVKPGISAETITFYENYFLESGMRAI